MKIFISWAGPRSRTLGTCMQSWIGELMKNDEIFHSDDIPKGSGWYGALNSALRNCDVGIFCITPESLRSQWMLFEAGALSSQIGDRPGMFAYLYGISEFTGPLSHFQATHFDRADTLKFVESLSRTSSTPRNSILKAFDKTWPKFEAKVLRLMARPIEDVLPNFPKLFEDSKTFNEPFPECPDKRWAARVARISRIQERLSTSEYSEIMSSDPYLKGAYNTLKKLLDRYYMHIVEHLIDESEFDSLKKKAQRQLEGVRKEIVDVVWALKQRSDPPVFRESFGFESDTSTPGRKNSIHEMQMRIRSQEIEKSKINRGRNSLKWGLDRIVYYLAAGSGQINTSLEDLIDQLRMEEEQARTRGLTVGLQPLYYALKCVDDFISEPPDPATSGRLLELLKDIKQFIDARDSRDRGGHIEQRLASVQQKLKGPSGRV